ncbi:hypothetical protein B484DRAFT_417974, partial [Ochromonadaceae sp. CCMP2298]
MGERGMGMGDRGIGMGGGGGGGSMGGGGGMGDSISSVDASKLESRMRLIERTRVARLKESIRLHWERRHRISPYVDHWMQSQSPSTLEALGGLGLQGLGGALEAIGRKKGKRPPFRVVTPVLESKFRPAHSDLCHYLPAGAPSSTPSTPSLSPNHAYTANQSQPQSNPASPTPPVSRSQTADEGDRGRGGSRG